MKKKCHVMINKKIFFNDIIKILIVPPSNPKEDLNMSHINCVLCYGSFNFQNSSPLKEIVVLLVTLGSYKSKVYELHMFSLLITMLLS